MIVIVDYGMGNLHSVQRAFAQVSTQPIIITADENIIAKAERIILPGQGAMQDCMKALNQSGLKETVVQAITNKPTFGICVGMQMLFENSEESIETPALGLFKGTIKKLPHEYLIDQTIQRQKVPHIGWNTVYTKQKQHPVLKDLHITNDINTKNQNFFYFVHSYACMQSEHSLLHTHYGLEFTSAIAYDNIIATQFHPEKSGKIGLKLYENFINWQP